MTIAEGTLQPRPQPAAPIASQPAQLSPRYDERDAAGAASSPRRPYPTTPSTQETRSPEEGSGPGTLTTASERVRSDFDAFRIDPHSERTVFEELWSAFEEERTMFDELQGAIRERESAPRRLESCSWLVRGALGPQEIRSQRRGNGLLVAWSVSERARRKLEPVEVLFLMPESDLQRVEHRSRLVEAGSVLVEHGFLLDGLDPQRG